MLKDALVAIGERLKESEMILIMLGGLTEDYKSFITSITTRFDHSMMFSSLCELMDQEMREFGKALVLGTVNVVTKYDARSPEDKGDYSWKSKVTCQICGCKHTMQ